MLPSGRYLGRRRSRPRLITPTRSLASQRKESQRQENKNKSKRKPWTDDEIKCIWAMYHAGYEIREIGVVLGRFPKDVQHQVSRLGLPGRNQAWSPEEMEHARRLFDQGVDVANIAIALGRTQSGVAKKLIAPLKHKLPKPRKSRRPQYDPELDAAIEVGLVNGDDNFVIAERWNEFHPDDPTTSQRVSELMRNIKWRTDEP